MNFIDKLNRFIGNAVAWLVILIVSGTLYNVIARYFFQSFSVPLSEIVSIMNAIVFLLSAPLLLYLDQHVRLDIFYARLSTRRQAMVDIFGTLFFLFPFCIFILYYSWNYVAASWAQHETSAQTGGLGGLYLVKSLIMIVAILLLLQGISQLIHKFQLIKNPKQSHLEPHHKETSL
ncbi:MAG: TRAP transporter small permease subunit [Ostreibacterium sp.]